MARPLRIEYDGAVYHITSRGNDRKAIYRDDYDRDMFLSILQRVAKRFHWNCHAYCLMNNHYHLIIETPDCNLSRGMQQLNGVYTQAYNRRHKRVGHIFQGRYKAIVIDKESYLLEACRYVVLNPVRAEAVKRPDQWKWSSYRGTAGTEHPHECLKTAWLLEQFARVAAVARRKYIEFVFGGIGKEGLLEEVRGRVVLGGKAFAEEMRRHIEDKAKRTAPPMYQRHLARQTLAEIFRAAEGKRERDLAIERAVEEQGYSQREVADHLGLHYSTISRILGNQE